MHPICSLFFACVICLCWFVWLLLLGYRCVFVVLYDCTVWYSVMAGGVLMYVERYDFVMGESAPLHLLFLVRERFSGRSLGMVRRGVISCHVNLINA